MRRPIYDVMSALSASVAAAALVVGLVSTGSMAWADDPVGDPIGITPNPMAGNCAGCLVGPTSARLVSPPG